MIPFTDKSRRVKYLGIILSKEAKYLYSENIDTNEINQRQHTQMERQTMFLNWKNQYCQNDYTIQSNL